MLGNTEGRRRRGDRGWEGWMTSMTQWTWVWVNSLRSIESVMPSIHLTFCCPLLLPPSIFPSIRVFSNESTVRMRWPKYWSFSFSISPSNEHLGLISFRMDWSDLLAVQGTLKSLLQHHSSKASILQLSLYLTCSKFCFSYNAAFLLLVVVYWILFHPLISSSLYF